VPVRVHLGHGQYALLEPELYEADAALLAPLPDLAGGIRVDCDPPRCPACGGLNPGDATHTRCHADP